MQDVFVLKQWGVTTPLVRMPKQHIDLARIAPGGYCSVHYHLAKNNLFYVTTGSIFVHIFDGDSLIDRHSVTADKYFEVAAGIRHRFWSQSGANVCEIYTPSAKNGIFFPNDADDIFRFSQGGISEKEPSTCQP